MDDLNIKPPAAPGAPKQKKKGFFANLFKKDVDDVRLTENTFHDMNLEDIRRKAGIIEDSAEIPSLPENNEPVHTLETEPEGMPEMPPSLTDEEFALPKESRELPTIDPVLEEATEQLVEEPIAPPAEAVRFDEENISLPDFDEVEREYREWLLGGDDEKVPSDWTEHEETHSDKESEWTQQETVPDGDQSAWTELSEPSANEPSEWAEHTEENETVQATSWAADVAHTEADATTQEESRALPHHDTVDTALAPIAKKHASIDAELKNITESMSADVAEWKMQKKEVHPNNYFQLKNGQAIKSFRDLLDALSFIDDDTFDHHVTEERNDFAEWIHHVLDEEKLAGRIRNKQTRVELLKALRAHETRMLKAFEKDTKKLQSQADKQKKYSEKIAALETKFNTLQKQLEKRSENLHELRGAHSQKIKKHLDQHVATQVEEAQTDITLDREALNKRESALNERESAVTKRETTLQKEQEKFSVALEELATEQEALKKDKEEAQELLTQTETVRADKEEAIRARTEAEEILKKNTRAQREAEKAKNAAERKQQTVQKQQEQFAEQKKELMELKKDLTTRERTMLKAEKDADVRVTKADEWHTKVLRERENWKKEKSQGEAALKEQRKEVEALMQSLEMQKQEYKDMIAEHENNLQRNQDILQETENVRNEIRNRQEALESHSMQDYLGKKAILAGDFSPNAPPVEEITNLHLYKLIDQCKAALGQNEVKKARHVYNQLREEFGQTKLSSHEKSVLYNNIRELYDDIHLALLNQ